MLEATVAATAKPGPAGPGRGCWRGQGLVPTNPSRWKIVFSNKGSKKKIDVTAFSIDYVCPGANPTKLFTAAIYKFP